MCANLIEQLQSRLEESRDDIGLLWRLSRVFIHASTHRERREEKEEEKRLLQQGRRSCDLLSFSCALRAANY